TRRIAGRRVRRGKMLLAAAARGDPDKRRATATTESSARYHPRVGSPGGWVDALRLRVSTQVTRWRHSFLEEDPRYDDHHYRVRPLTRWRQGTGARHARSLALEEVGRPYQVRLVSFRAMKEPAHLALHPFGQIPTYEEGDLALFETGAIVLHLAQRTAGL